MYYCDSKLLKTYLNINNSYDSLTKNTIDYIVNIEYHMKI